MLEKVESADRVNSLVAYTGAFPIAAAMAAGADIVITGRAVDSAMALGPLIHEFGWGPDDFDLLAAGTLAGHLLECSAQVTGGTFTDWRDVPDWAGIGMPIGECSADGGLVITKPEGTGGLVSVGTVAEQLLYEVSDPQRYYVADVVCDFTDVRLEQIGPDRVAVTGARGLGRTATCKASLTYEQGWRASALIPIIGLEAAAKAERLGQELIARTNTLLRQSQLPPLTRTHCEVIGGEGTGPTTALCRLVADHPDQEGAQVLIREQSSAISHMSVGISLSLAAWSTPAPAHRRISAAQIDCFAEGLARRAAGGLCRGDGCEGHEAEALPRHSPNFPATSIRADRATDPACLGQKRRQGQSVQRRGHCPRGRIPALYRRRANPGSGRCALWQSAWPWHRACG